MTYNVLNQADPAYTVDVYFEALQILLLLHFDKITRRRRGDILRTIRSTSIKIDRAKSLSDLVGIAIPFSRPDIFPKARFVGFALDLARFRLNGPATLSTPQRWSYDRYLRVYQSRFLGLSLEGRISDKEWPREKVCLALTIPVEGLLRTGRYWHRLLTLPKSGGGPHHPAPTELKTAAVRYVTKLLDQELYHKIILQLHSAVVCALDHREREEMVVTLDYFQTLTDEEFRVEYKGLDRKQLEEIGKDMLDGWHMY